MPSICLLLTSLLLLVATRSTAEKPADYDPASSRYHLIYQHNPYADTWGPTRFGHATSTDLVNWQHEPIAVWPSYELGEGNGYSGGDKYAVCYLHHDREVVGRMADHLIGRLPDGRGSA